MGATSAKAASASACRWRTISRWGLSLCLILLVACQTLAAPLGKVQAVRVQRVASGQALEVINAEGTPGLTEPVRLIGLDAPELEQRPWGPQAQRFLNDWIGPTGENAQQPRVRLEFDRQETDRYQRKLAYVWVDDTLLNEQLVAEGHALAVPSAPNLKYEERLRRAQERARLLGLGIWAPEQPMRITPSEFRRQYQ